MTVRPASAEDIDRLLAIHTAAFPDGRSVAVRKRNFEHSRFGRFEDLRVLERDDAIVAHAFLFPFELFFGGRRVKTAGIASVGVAPEARGHGVARELLGALENEARERGDVLALLHPFRQSFYSGLGYAPVTPLARFEASPRAVPDAWVKEARLAKIRAATGRDADAIERAYLRHAERTTGLMVRPPMLWERKNLDERRHVLVLERGREIAGYVAFNHDQDEAHADVVLAVEELVYDDDLARRLLVGALGAQRDQVRFIVFVTSREDWLGLALEDADRDHGGTEQVEHALGTLMSGPMVKVLDVEAALAARGYVGSGTLSLRTETGGPFEMGAKLPPTTVLTMVAEGGGARVSRGGTPLATVSPRALASVFFGSVSARDAVRLGWMEASREATAAIDAIAALPPFEVVDAF